MSALAEASALVRDVAEPRPVGDSVKAAIVRAARRLGFTFTRTKDIWYGDARRIDSGEMDALRRAKAERRQSEARGEARAAVGRLLALREMLARRDPHFHREDIAALERALRAMGSDVGSRDVGDGSFT